jgi:hypothetical protein
VHCHTIGSVNLNTLYAAFFAHQICQGTFNFTTLHTAYGYTGRQFWTIPSPAYHIFKKCTDFETNLNNSQLSREINILQEKSKDLTSLIPTTFHTFVKLLSSSYPKNIQDLS